jgi:hypothetical protein
MWWLGLCPNHHIYGSLLRARGIFITLPGRLAATLVRERDGKLLPARFVSRTPDRAMEEHL